jgi:hypothetical protein
LDQRYPSYSLKCLSYFHSRVMTLQFSVGKKQITTSRQLGLNGKAQSMNGRCVEQAIALKADA